MDMAGVGGDKISGFFGPFDAGDGLRVIDEIDEPDILELLQGVEPVTIKVIKGHLCFIDMHKHKRRAFYLFRIPQALAFGEPLDEGRLPAPKVPFQTQDRARLETRAKTLREVDGFLG